MQQWYCCRMVDSRKPTKDLENINAGKMRIKHQKLDIKIQDEKLSENFG